MPTTIHSPVLADLHRQLRHAIPQRQDEFVQRLEQLHDEMLGESPERTYPLDFVLFRVLRVSVGESVGLYAQARSDELLADLRAMIDALSRAHPTEEAHGREPLYDPVSAAERLGVSRKTVDRWRNIGLRWRWVRPAGGGRVRVGLPESAVTAFVEAFPNRARRAARFGQIPPEQRDRLIGRARRLLGARDGLSPFAIARHLARRTGRSLEAIRQLLLRHDRDHPESPLFPTYRAPLSRSEARGIAHAYRSGVSVDEMARRLGRGRSSVYRAIHRRRLSALLRLGLSYSQLPTFERPEADEVFLRPEPELALEGTPQAVPAVLADWFAGPAMGRDAAWLLQVRWNYLKFKADRARLRLDRFEPSAQAMAAIESWLRSARDLRRRLVLGALPSLWSAARRHQGVAGPLAHEPPRELLLLGLPSVIDAVDGFDIATQHNPPAYVEYCLMRTLAQADVPDAGKARRRPDAQRLRDELGRLAADRGVRLAAAQMHPQDDNA